MSFFTIVRMKNNSMHRRFSLRGKRRCVSIVLQKIRRINALVMREERGFAQFFKEKVG